MFKKIRASAFWSGFLGGVCACILFGGGGAAVWAAVGNWTVSSSTTADGVTVGRFTANSTGTPAAGFGPRAQFIAQDASKTDGGDPQCNLTGRWLTATAGAEAAYLGVSCRTGGTAVGTDQILIGFPATAAVPEVRVTDGTRTLRMAVTSTSAFVGATSNHTLNLLSNSQAVLALAPTTVTVLEAANLVLGTTTGTKIGTATTQKLGFWNATAVVQPTSTATTTTGFTANASANVVCAESTFTGNVGSTAYHVSDIINNLKTAGILAQ